MSGMTLPAMGGSRAHSSRYRLTTAVVLGLTAAIVAKLLARRALHGFDAFLALRAAITGEDQSTGTLLYVPLARGARWALQSIVPDAFAVLQLLSALGLGLAVAFVYLAATRLRLRSPTLVALSLLSLPAAAYFGATVEVDALLLGGSSIAWWASIPFARRPLPTRAMRLGSITGITASFHGGGQLLFVAILTVTGMHVFRRCRRQRSARPARR